MNLKSLLLFFLPALMLLKVNFVGTLYVPELVLLIYFIFLLTQNSFFLIIRKLRLFVSLVLLLLLSQIVTDIYRETPPQDFLRGWFNIVFLLINTVTLFVLLDNDKKNFFIFGLGFALGWILGFYFTPNYWAFSDAIVTGDSWKFGYGYAVTFLVAIITTLQYFKNNFFKSIIFLFLAILNFYFDFRTLGGVCLLVFFFLTIMKLKFFNQFLKNKKSNSFHIFRLTCFLTILSFFVYHLYSYLAINEYLGLDAMILFKNQSGPLGILVGGRQELLTSFYAISESPIIGYGSWAKSPFHEELLSDLLIQFGYYDTTAITYFGDRIPTHSHIFGSWITAGIFGIFIWIWFLYMILKSLLVNTIINDSWNGFFYFICFIMMWSIFFGNFSGTARFYDGYYLSILLFINSKFNSSAK